MTVQMVAMSIIKLAIERAFQDEMQLQKLSEGNIQAIIS